MYLHCPTMESQAGQPARDSTDATTPVPGGSFSHEQLVRVPHLPHPTLQAHQASRYGDTDRGSNGWFGFHACGVRGRYKCVAHRTAEYLGQRTGRRL
jgi:hypothetical protein